MKKAVTLHWKGFRSLSAAFTECGASDCVYAIWARAISQVLYVGQTSSLRRRYHVGFGDATLAAIAGYAAMLNGYRDAARQAIENLPDTVVNAAQRRQIIDVLPPAVEQAHFFVANIAQNGPLSVLEIEDELLNRTLPIFNRNGITESPRGSKIGYPDPDILIVHAGHTSFASFLNGIETGIAPIPRGVQHHA